MAWQSFKEKSRENFGRDFCGDKSQNITWQEARDGALLRIADAAEKIALNHSALIEERDRYQRYWKEGQICEKRMWHRITGLKGCITRMKKQTKKV